MKSHIGPIYLILGCMAVAALTIGAKPEHHEAHTRKGAATAIELPALPAPPAAAQERVVVVVSPTLEAGATGSYF